MKDLNVEINEGDTIVCVGQNGSGKTTFVNLLLGLYEPVEGNVTVNGVLVQDIRHQLRASTAIVLQKFNQYQMTIEENIVYSRGLKKEEFQKISQDIVSFIKDLPKKEKTSIGQLDRDSIELSGGQWQRLAICRALLKPKTKLMILDEFTAALDPLIESKIYDEIKDKIKHHTTIITSHRLGVCSLADLILVFDKGQIVERGSHQALMEKRGLYYCMYNNQISLFI